MVYISWEKVYLKNKDDIYSKVHVLMAYTHYLCIRKGFLCAGLGVSTSGPIVDFHQLPVGWNQNLPCTFRYSYRQLMFIIKFVKEGRIVKVLSTMPLLAEGPEYKVTFNLSDIRAIRGKLPRMMPHYRRIHWDINTGLLDGLVQMASFCPGFHGKFPLIKFINDCEI